jgi:hypothetical protein
MRPIHISNARQTTSRISASIGGGSAPSNAFT